MKTTRAINVTGNPNFQYVPSNKGHVGATMKKWLRDYEKAWDEAHAQNGSPTGRQCTSEPQLQNIPLRTEEGGRIRNAFLRTMK